MIPSSSRDRSTASFAAIHWKAHTSASDRPAANSSHPGGSRNFHVVPWYPSIRSGEGNSMPGNMSPPERQPVMSEDTAARPSRLT